MTITSNMFEVLLEDDRFTFPHHAALTHPASRLFRFNPIRLPSSPKSKREQVPPRHWVGTYLAYSSSRRGIASSERAAVRLDRARYVCGGLAGGLLYRWRPKLAQHPLIGFCLTLGVSSLRNGLFFVFADHSPAARPTIEEIGRAPLLQGLGTALILAIVARVRDRDEQTRAVVSADIRALQMRMNPHFLFNALNALAALAKVAPREVPRATGRLRQFLQASFSQPERTLVPLEEELAVVDAYLDIESLRFGGRLEVEQTIGPGLLKVLVPPFSFQPSVENAIEHGLRSLPGAGRLRLVIRTTGPWPEMNVTDNGQGVPSTEVERLFFAERPQVHALVLLRRRLQGLFGRSFQLEVRSEIGEGTTITMRIPLQARFQVMGRSLETLAHA